MNNWTWTASAQTRLEQFLADRPLSWGLSGVAAAEMEDDLRSHVHEELRREGVATVTLETLERILVRIGGPPAGSESPRPMPSEARPVSVAPTPPKTGAGCSGFLMVFMALLVAPVAWLIETFGSFCSSHFFDPMPTMWHVGVVAIVVYITAHQVVMRVNVTPTDYVRWAFPVGFALVVAFYYALLFVPLLPQGIIASLILVGLLPLVPLFTLVMLWKRWFEFMDMASAAGDAESRSTSRGLGWGAVAGVVVLLALEVPFYATRYMMSGALAESQGARTEQVQKLRAWGSESVMLSMCEDVASRSLDPSDWLESDFLSARTRPARLHTRVLRCRELYYQVTGRLYSDDAARRPWWLRQHATRTIDSGLGGNTAASQVSGLSLVESRVDGHLSVASGLTYQEWTCVFANEHKAAREARFQVQLPARGVVSRLTLWVNGEPQEAAFGAISAVKAAYKAVAVVQRRDPVLVTVCGPDRVFVQCFPVPPSGGRMQIRLGITAPLTGSGLTLPVILENNFRLNSRLEQTVWMQGDAAITCREAGKTSHSVKGMQALSHSFAAGVLRSGAAFLATGKPAARVWSEDPFAAPAEKFVTRTFVKKLLPPLGTPIVVLDGSAGTVPFLADIRAALGERDIFLAGDAVREVKLSELKPEDFRGGCDNTGALLAAELRAAESPGSVILWIHGPQPMAWQDRLKLLQQVEKGRAAAVIFDVALANGPNRIVETLMPMQILQPGPRLEQMAAWLSQATTGLEERTPHYERGPEPPVEGVRVWDQLARYETYESLLTDAATGGMAPEKTLRAARYQLVTPWSGAVVLETKEQFRQHGLDQVDPKSVPEIPVVPEPSTGALLIPSIWLLLRRRRP